MIDLVGDSRKRWRVIGLCLCLGLIVFAFAFLNGAYDGHSEEFLMKPGGMIVFSFAGCWVLIIMAKLIMTPLLQRDEDYYEKKAGDGHD